MQVLRSLFADDFSGGSKTTIAAFELYKKLKIRFLEGQFNLTKWRKNDKQLRLLISQIKGTEIPVLEAKFWAYYGMTKMINLFLISKRCWK